MEENGSCSHSDMTKKVEDEQLQEIIDGEMEELGVLKVDPELIRHVKHLKFRYTEYKKWKKDIETREGGLLNFSLGYQKFGINRGDGCVVYREWAPAAHAAQLVGEFNNWNGSAHEMEKDQDGVWTIRIADINGKPAIPHGSRLKFRMKKPDGIWIDLIPAWIKFAASDPAKMSEGYDQCGTYDGIYWDPPSTERYTFKHPLPKRSGSLRIYECHIGMSSVEAKVSTYVEFADNVLPRIKANNYNAVQFMAVAEHAYYGCFGYHVTSYFAPCSRYGTPEDFKYLVDKAHALGIQVLMDLVHGHASINKLDGLNGYDVGQSTQDSYFHTGERGYHILWDSRLFNYANWEVQRFLLSNLRWWLDEFKLDGFRFDGITSMLYTHHGINMSFSGDYLEYFGENTDVDAVIYMTLANELIHGLNPDAITVAEDVSGMPTLCRPISEGGMGFDYRLAMGIPDRWMHYLKEKRPDEKWSMGEIVHTMLYRRHTERCVAYAECHDQCIVGDNHYAWDLMGEEMFTGMSVLQEPSPVVQRGIALHKMIHFISMALGGESYLNFMGNEFGHPEWVDFPREGNAWSFERCRRRWDLVDRVDLRYKFMNNFDRDMNALDEKFNFSSSPNWMVSDTNEDGKVIVFERAELVFIFNFHSANSYSRYKVGCHSPGTYGIILDSDAPEYDGFGRIDHEEVYSTSPEGVTGKPETYFNNCPYSLTLFLPSRSCQVYCKTSSR